MSAQCQTSPPPAGPPGRRSCPTISVRNRRAGLAVVAAQVLPGPERGGVADPSVDLCDPSKLGVSALKDRCGGLRELGRTPRRKITENCAVNRIARISRFSAQQRGFSVHRCDERRAATRRVRRSGPQIAGRYQRGDVVGGGSSAARATRTVGSGSATWRRSAAAKSSLEAVARSRARTPKERGERDEVGRAQIDAVRRRPRAVAGRSAASRSRRRRRSPSSPAGAPARRSRARRTRRGSRRRPRRDTTGPAPASAAPSDCGKREAERPPAHRVRQPPRRGARRWNPPSQ